MQGPRAAVLEPGIPGDADGDAPGHFFAPQTGVRRRTAGKAERRVVELLAVMLEELTESLPINHRLIQAGT